MLRQNIHTVNISIRRNSLYGIFQRPSPTFILPNNRALLYPYVSIYVQKKPDTPFYSSNTAHNSALHDFMEKAAQTR